MGFRFRRSLQLFPGLRLNLSRSGASVSVGPRGLRYTVGPKGTRVTAGIPGTGLSWTEYTPHGNSSPSSPSPTTPNEVSPSYLEISQDPSFVAIQSAPAETLNALSISDLAPILNTAQRRFRWTPIVAVICLAVLGLSLASGMQALIVASFVYAVFSISFSMALDRYRRSVRIKYVLEGPASTVAKTLAETFAEIRNCAAVWSVTAKGNTKDWKRNAGATTLNERKPIKLQFTKPSCIRGDVKFPALKSVAQELYFLPDAALIVTGGAVAALAYRELNCLNRSIRFIEEASVPRDATVIDHTWRFVNKNGGPDRRFNFNKQLPICAYGEMSFYSESGLNCVIQYSGTGAGQRFSKAIEILRRPESHIDSKPITKFETAIKWPSRVFVSSFVFIGAIVVALGVANFPSAAFAPSQTNLLPITKVEKPQAIAPQSIPQVREPIRPSLSPNRNSGAKQNATARSGKVQNDAEQRFPPAPLSIAQCLSIPDVDERVDCFEQAHANSK